MIYFYLNDGAVNRYNLNFELDKAENYGVLIQKLLINITNYIYGVQKIILVKQEDVENIVEINLETDIEMLDKIDDSDKIVKILIYERERHENGNVKKCNLVDKYLEYDRIRQDELFAQSIENERYSRRRYSVFSTLPTTNSRITNRIANALYNSINSTLRNNPDNTDTDTDSWDEENVEPIVTDPVMTEPLISEISTDTIANNVANSLADNVANSLANTIVNTMNETIDETTNLINDLNDTLYNGYANLEDVSLEDISENPLSIIGNTISSRVTSRYSNSINNIANSISDTIEDLLNSTDTSIDNAVFTGLFNGISTIYNSFPGETDETSEISNTDEPVNNIPVSPITVTENIIPPPPPPPPLPPRELPPIEEPILISNSFGERDPMTGFERVDGSIPRPPPLPPPLISSVRPPPPLPSRSRRPNIPMLPPGIRSVIRRTNTSNQERRNANLTVNPLFRNRSERLNRAARIFADTYRSTQDFLESRVNMVAPEEEVDKFKIVSYSEIKDNDDYPKLTKCNITLEEFEDDTQVMILPCKHYYMIEPLKKWLLEHSNKCPMCRKECCKGKPSY